MTEQSIAVREPEQLTAKDVRAQVNLVQEVMKAVMQKGTHYGTIPGCGEKPTLLKPGAEKLASTFRLAINPEIEDMSLKDVVRFRIRAMITHQNTGAFLGAGVGECSSNEEKYCWRNAVCKEEYDETPEDRRRKKWRKGYGGKVETAQQVRTNPADLANTILKMAKKRALVDGILTVCGASDIFTQDIEDMPEELLDKKVEAVRKPPMEQPPPPTDEQPPPPDGLPVDAPEQSPVISDPQRKRMYAIARAAGLNDTQFKEEIVKMGFGSSKDVTRASYEDICTHFEGMKH